MKYLLIPIIACIALLSGCASTVNRGQSSIKETSQVKEIMVQNIKFTPIKSVSISLDANTQKKLADNANFSEQKLREKLRQVLVSGNYLQSENANAKLQLDVLITNIRVRSAASAILLGFFAGADNITGQVFLKDGDKVIDNFEVDISYAFGGAMGDTEVRMNWMYDSFSTKIHEELKKLMPMTK
jgi:hypothetical protein